MADKHYIYVTTNNINSKKYIGQHITNCDTIDCMLNDGYLGSGTLLLKAIRKYGKENFAKQIVSIHTSQKETDEAEINYIESHKVLQNKNVWYNRSAGGQYNRGEKHSEIMSEIMKEVVNSNEYRINRGWLTLEEREEKRLFGMRKHLINTLYRIRKVKKKQEDYHRFNLVYGVNKPSEYKRALFGLSQKDRMEKVILHNEYQRTDDARQEMSRKLREKYKAQGTDGHKWSVERKIAKSTQKSKSDNTKLRSFLIANGISPDSIKRVRRYSNGEYKTNTGLLRGLNGILNEVSKMGIHFDIQEYYTEYMKYFTITN